MSAETDVRLRPSSDVIGHRLGDEFVLIHLQTNKMYELNVTAARIWELLDEGCGRAEIEGRLLDEFDADDGVVPAEVDALLAHLASERLISE